MNNLSTASVSLFVGGRAGESQTANYTRRKSLCGFFGRGFDYRHLHQNRCLRLLCGAQAENG